MLFIIGCGIDTKPKYPILVTDKKNTSYITINNKKINKCEYKILIEGGWDSWFEAPCDWANTGDTLNTNKLK